MNITGLVLALPVGIVTGILGIRADVPVWITAIVSTGAAIAVLEFCIFMGLP